MRIMLLILGSIFLMVGLVSMVTPIPGGTLLIATGCGLLICTSKRFANWIKKQRTGKAWLNKGMTWIEDKLGERLGGPMRMTRPTSQTRF